MLPRSPDNIFFTLGGTFPKRVPTHLGLLGGDAVDGEAALHVVDQTEELTGLLEGDDI